MNNKLKYERGSCEHEERDHLAGVLELPDHLGGDEAAEAASETGFGSCGHGVYLPAGMKSVWPTTMREGSASRLALMMSCCRAPVFFAVWCF